MDGKAPFTYEWDDLNSTIENVTMLQAGLYNVSIYDINNCSMSYSFMIGQPDRLVISWTSTNLSCIGSNDGTLEVSAIGGIQPYTYNLTNGYKSNAVINKFKFDGLPAAIQAVPDIIVYQDSLVAPFEDWGWGIRNYSYSDVKLSGTSSIAYTPANYDAVYIHCNFCMDITLHEGISFWMNGLQGGQRMQIIMDQLCPACLHGQTNIFGAENDEAILPPDTWIQFFYNFSNVKGLPASNPTKLAGIRISDESGRFTNNMLVIDDIRIIPKKDYSRASYVEVVDSTGCRAKTDYIIDVKPEMNITVKSARPKCYGGNGDFLASISNGVGPFSYTWIPSYQKQNPAKLQATVSYKYDIIYDDGLQLNFVDKSSVQVTYDNTIYFRGNSSTKYVPSKTGQLMWYVNSPFNASLYMGIEFWIYSTKTITKDVTLAISTYVNNNYYNTLPFNLYILTNLSAIPVGQWVKAFYNFDAINAKANYNAILLQSSLSDSDQAIYIDEVRFVFKSDIKYDVNRVDYYRVEVTDNAKCFSKTDYITIDEPEGLSVDISLAHATCDGSNNGRVTASPKGGSPPYSYNWTVLGPSQISGGLQFPIVSGLQPSSAYVQVTDSHLCTTISQPVRVVQPPKISYTVKSVPSTCYKSNDGHVTVTAQGGMPPYSFSYSGFTSSYVEVRPVYVFTDYPNTAMGFYNMTIWPTASQQGSLQDTSIPAQSGYYSISFIPQVRHTFSISCDSCITNEDYLAISFWLYLDSSSPIGIQYGVSHSTDLSNSNFNVNPNSAVLLFNSSNSKQWFEVKYYLDLTVFDSWDTFYITGLNDSNTAKLYIDTIALIPRWFTNKPVLNNIASGFKANFYGLPNIKHQLLLKDSNGCVQTVDAVIEEPKPLSVRVAMSGNPTVKSANDGNIVIEASGGVPPYEYLWDQKDSFGPELKKLNSGVYTVQVKDNNGCSINETITLYSDYEIVKPSKVITGLLSVIVVVCLLLDIFAIFLILTKTEYYLDKSPLFCKIIHFGALVAHIAAAGLIMEPNDRYCTAFPWLVGISFVLVYGCLFLKTWRLFWIVRASEKLQRVSLTNIYIIKLLGFFFAVEIVFLIIWTTMDPPQATLSRMINNKKQIQCNCKYEMLFWGIFLAYKCVWLLFGVGMAIGSRNMVERFNESKQVYYCIYNITVVCIICLPLLVLLGNVPFASTVIQVVELALMFTFTLVALYFDIWMKILTSKSSSSGESSVGPSRKNSHMPMVSESGVESISRTTISVRDTRGTSSTEMQSVSESGVASAQ